MPHLHHRIVTVHVSDENATFQVMSSLHTSGDLVTLSLALTLRRND